MSLDTRLFFCRFSDGPRLHRRDVLDTIVARLPEAEHRARIAQHGAVVVALREFNWLFNEGGAESLMGPTMLASLSTVRRIGEAPVYLTPLDLIRRFHALGWIPHEQLAQLPAEALEPPCEQDAISLDHVIARFLPTGPDAHLKRADALREHAHEIVAAMEAHVEEHTARHGELGADEDVTDR